MVSKLLSSVGAAAATLSSSSSRSGWFHSLPHQGGEKDVCPRHADHLSDARRPGFTPRHQPRNSLSVPVWQSQSNISASSGWSNLRDEGEQHITYENFWIKSVPLMTGLYIVFPNVSLCEKWNFMFNIYTIFLNSI